MGNPIIDKKKLHYYLRRLQHVKIWHLLVLLVILSFASATLLRLNNLGMDTRREAVIEADKKGDPKKVEAALIDLQRYVGSHMNTSLKQGVYLEESYARDREAAIKAASETSSNPASAAYQKASIECRSQFVGGVESFRNDYVQCVLDRVAALGGSSDPLEKLEVPSSDFYRHNFTSPIISFDAAGISVILTLLLGVISLLLVGFEILAKLLLKKHQQGVYS